MFFTQMCDGWLGCASAKPNNSRDMDRGPDHRWVCDLRCSATVVAYIKKQGGTVSQVMWDLAQEILSWRGQLVIYLTAWYIPRKKNILADSLVV